MAARARRDHARLPSLMGLRGGMPGRVAIPIRPSISTSKVRSSPPNLSPRALSIVPSSQVGLCGHAHSFAALATLLPHAQLTGASKVAAALSGFALLAAASRRRFSPPPPGRLRWLVDASAGPWRQASASAGGAPRPPSLAGRSSQLLGWVWESLAAVAGPQGGREDAPTFWAE